MFIDVREEGRKKRNISVREKHRSVATHTHTPTGIKPTTWVCALTRNRTHNLLVYRTTLQPIEPPGQGSGSHVLNQLCYLSHLFSPSRLSDHQRWHSTMLDTDTGSVAKIPFSGSARSREAFERQVQVLPLYLCMPDDSLNVREVLAFVEPKSEG